MSIFDINRPDAIPEEILNKLKKKKKYIDSNKYIFLEEKYYYENPYYVMTEKVEEKVTQNIYTRTLYIIFKNTSKIIANRINQRRNWKPFNLQDKNGIIENSNTTTIGDEIFMEMNPNLFKIKDNKDKDISENNQSTQGNPYQNGCISNSRYISQNSVANLSGLGLSLFKNNKSGYIAPHLKRQREEEEQNLPKSIKIQNIPNYLRKEEIEDWLSQFRIGKFRLSYIRNKRTDLFKGFVFLNFNFNKDAVNSIKILEGQRLDYNIIEPSLAN
tara:strand:+ start:11492 stop:12307 length:816 start_codon:yes stop_codon:yes gene_type:complete